MRFETEPASATPYIESEFNFMRSKLLIVFISLVACTIFSAQAQAPSGNSILIGDARLRLGMSQESVIRALQSSYEISTVGNDGDFTFRARGRAHDASPEGYLSFRAGKLTEATKLWNGDEPNTADALSHAIYGAASSFTDPMAPCSIATFKSQKPNEEKRGVTLSCGDQHVDIFTSGVSVNGTWHEVAIVNESLRYK